MNFQYAVFIGVVVSLSFNFDSGPPSGVTFSVPDGRRLVYLLFVVYYFLDWLTANVREYREITSLANLSLHLFWVAFLGIVIIFLNSAGGAKFSLLAIYAIITGAHDIYEQRAQGNLNSPREVIALVLGGLRLLIAIPFIIPALAWLFGRSDVLAVWEAHLWLPVTLYLGLKFARYKLLAIEVATP